MPILVSYFRLLGAKTRRALSSKDVLGRENLAVNSHYLDYNALKKEHFHHFLFNVYGLFFHFPFYYTVQDKHIGKFFVVL